MRQILTSTDVRFWRIETVKKELIIIYAPKEDVTDINPRSALAVFNL